MRALEFKSKIKNNQIIIPTKMLSEFKSNDDKNIRVIVLIDEVVISDDLVFQQATQDQFLMGYADSDAIYDTY